MLKGGIMETLKELTEEQREFIESLLDELPPVIARKQIDKFLGGVVAAQTLANADGQGEGPEISYKVGRSIVYKTESLLRWIVQNLGVAKMKNIRKK